MNSQFWKRHRVLGAAFLAVLLVMAAVPMIGHASPASLAPDGPGALSHFDLARNDCLGTARNATLKVWFTIASGVLSDVYYPTNDNTNVETLQYIVTDGTSFTDLQTRDTTYTVQPLSSRALDCRVTATAKSGKYRIVTDYLTDPNRNTVVMNTHFVPLVGDLSTYQLYVRYDPSINGNGGGGPRHGGGGTRRPFTPPPAPVPPPPPLRPSPDPGNTTPPLAAVHCPRAP